MQASWRHHKTARCAGLHGEQLRHGSPRECAGTGHYQRFLNVAPSLQATLRLNGHVEDQVDGHGCAPCAVRSPTPHSGEYTTAGGWTGPRGISTGAEINAQQDNRIVMQKALRERGVSGGNLEEVAVGAMVDRVSGRWV